MAQDRVEKYDASGHQFASPVETDAEVMALSRHAIAFLIDIAKIGADA